MSKAIHQEVVFEAGPERIYEALMDSKRHAEFTANGAADISRDAGGRFSAHGGFVQGRNVELVPNTRIVQAWRGADWPEGCYSIATYELRPEGKSTRLIFDQAGIPDEKAPHIDDGWHKMYWEPLKKYLATTIG
jgi:uncharacterized protein YndB with AHSA1/START domain